MSTNTDIESLSLTEQAVLLAVVELDRDGKTPAQTHDIRRVCRTRLSNIETEVIGTISEADAMRSLYRLEAAGIVEERRPDEPSPTGKGRPAYTLNERGDVICDTIADELVEERNQ